MFYAFYGAEKNIFSHGYEDHWFPTVYADEDKTRLRSFYDKHKQFITGELETPYYVLSDFDGTLAHQERLSLCGQPQRLVKHKDSGLGDCIIFGGPNEKILELSLNFCDNLFKSMDDDVAQVKKEFRRISRIIHPDVSDYPGSFLMRAAQCKLGKSDDEKDYSFKITQLNELCQIAFQWIFVTFCQVSGLIIVPDALFQFSVYFSVLFFQLLASGMQFSLVLIYILSWGKINFHKGLFTFIGTVERTLIGVLRGILWIYFEEGMKTMLLFPFILQIQDRKPIYIYRRDGLI